MWGAAEGERYNRHMADVKSPSPCPVSAAERIISGKWTLLILRDLASGAQRFSALERSLDGISTRTLSQRLKALEEEGIISRAAPPSGGCRADYRLTRKGKELLPVVEAMRQWGERWCDSLTSVLKTDATAGETAKNLQGA